MARVLSNNALVNHPSYSKILARYNQMMRDDGRVNNKKFYEMFVVTEIPTYKMCSWYKFLGRFQDEAGISAPVPDAPVIQGAVAEDTAIVLRDNQTATVTLIQNILNISAQAAQQVLDDPKLISLKDRIKLGLDVMKAQDSRVKAIGNIKADNREQQRFEQAMGNAAYD